MADNQILTRTRGLTRQQLNGLRGRFLPIYRKAMADSGGDLWGHSPTDLACDNLPGVHFYDIQELVRDLGLVSFDEAAEFARGGKRAWR